MNLAHTENAAEEDKVIAELTKLGVLVNVYNGSLKDDGGRSIGGTHIATIRSEQDIMVIDQYAKSTGATVIPLGSLTSATGNFPPNNFNPNGVILLDFAQHNLDKQNGDDKSRKYLFDAGSMTFRVAAGSVIGDNSGPNGEYAGEHVWIPGDATSVNSALTGAFVGTGPQGPLRLSPHYIIKEIRLVRNGGQLIVVTDPEQIRLHVGMLGHTGIVSNIVAEAWKIPNSRFCVSAAFAKDDLEGVADFTGTLMHQFGMDRDKSIQNKRLTSKTGSTDLIADGCEWFDKVALEAIIKFTRDNKVKSLAEKMLEFLNKTGNYRIILFTGFTNFSLHGFSESQQSPFHVLCEKYSHLIDFEDEFGFTPFVTAGSTENVLFKVFKALREAAPHSTRDKGKINDGAISSATTSTDINSQVKKEFRTLENVIVGQRVMLKPYLHFYAPKLDALAEKAETLGVELEYTIYGHVPERVDPHFRVMLHGKEKENVAEIFREVLELRKQLFGIFEQIADGNLPQDIQWDENEEELIMSKAIELTDPEKGYAVDKEYVAYAMRTRPIEYLRRMELVKQAGSEINSRPNKLTPESRLAPQYHELSNIAYREHLQSFDDDQVLYQLFFIAFEAGEILRDNIIKSNNPSKFTEQAYGVCRTLLQRLDGQFADYEFVFGNNAPERESSFAYKPDCREDSRFASSGTYRKLVHCSIDSVSKDPMRLELDELPSIHLSFVENGKIKHTLIWNPFTCECIYGSSEKGMFRNGQPIALREDEDANLDTVHKYTYGSLDRDRYADLLTAYRSLGGPSSHISQAPSLSAISKMLSDAEAGKHSLMVIDSAFLNEQLKHALQVVALAGGAISNLDGSSYDPRNPNDSVVVATSSKLIEELLGRIEETSPEAMLA